MTERTGSVLGWRLLAVSAGALLLTQGVWAGERGILPAHPEGPEAIRSSWNWDGSAWVSPPRAWPEGGSHWGALSLGERPDRVSLQLLSPSGDPLGPWLEVEPVWVGPEGHRVWSLELPERAFKARVKLDSLEGLRNWGWELLDPVGEPRRLSSEAAPPPAISSALSDIGVIAREDWGAVSTTCTSTEDDWYRFAIHHTAGVQTYGGTVQGAVQALQSYAMGSGGYCDIPYQFVMGYDGSLWEGRNLQYYSGATGSNNDGNIALSFLGCYDADDCGDSSHAETLIMMASTRLLAQTLAAQEETVTTEETLLGHGQWPDNATACPGDLIVPRIDELRQSVAHYQGVVLDAQPAPGSLSVSQGAELVLEVEILNEGIFDWDPGVTFLAPQSGASSPWAHADWHAADRIASPSSVIAPGETAVFQIPIKTDTLQSGSLELMMIQEGVSWFDESPIGGGLQGAALDYSITVSQDGEEPDSGLRDPSEQDTATSAWDPAGSSEDPLPSSWETHLIRSPGCQAAGIQQPLSLHALLAALGLMGLRRRSSASGPQSAARSWSPWRMRR